MKSRKGKWFLPRVGGGLGGNPSGARCCLSQCSGLALAETSCAAVPTSPGFLRSRLVLIKKLLCFGFFVVVWVFLNSN